MEQRHIFSCLDSLHKQKPFQPVRFQCLDSLKYNIGIIRTVTCALSDVLYENLLVGMSLLDIIIISEPVVVN